MKTVCEYRLVESKLRQPFTLIAFYRMKLCIGKCNPDCRSESPQENRAGLCMDKSHG